MEEVEDNGNPGADRDMGTTSQYREQSLYCGYAHIKNNTFKIVSFLLS